MKREDILKQAKANFLLQEEYLGEYATKSNDAIRLNESQSDFRSAYFRDVDKIIHSLSYTRYIDKTQVYSFKSNDHISKRIVHVQLVSKIARTIGRALCLNGDLIEAISLGHDIGHTPLGHIGESFLNEISKRELDEYFCHNVQSMRNYLILENNGLGSNLTIQTLDGILCHNGEKVLPVYEPVKKSKDEVLEQYYNCYKDKSYNNILPMTLEGCVVRIADIIAYIGRDIEDAINLGNLKREEIPDEITKVLGSSNKVIINTLIIDIIANSMNKNYIKLSDNVYNALNKLMDFNYKHIYNNANSSKDYEYYRQGMYKIYQVYLKDIMDNNKDGIIFKIFLDLQSEDYLRNTLDERKVLDFIAGMTDDFFIEQVKQYM